MPIDGIPLINDYEDPSLARKRPATEQAALRQILRNQLTPCNYSGVIVGCLVFRVPVGCWFKEVETSKTNEGPVDASPSFIENNRVRGASLLVFESKSSALARSIERTVMANYSNPSQLPDLTSQEVEQAFDSFDDELKLDPGKRIQAESFHRELTTRLKVDQIISSTFLQGSFARKTMLKPLRDIDKVVILDPRHAHLFTDVGGSALAAELVETALQGYYPNATCSRTRHSIQMDLGSDTFSFDVVPAYEADDGTTDVMIIDLKSGGWERSNTRTLIDVVAERNKTCDGLFIHQVRFVKHWSRHVLADRLPGLHVEAIAFACVDQPIGHAEAVARIFAYGAQLLSQRSTYADPTGVDELSSKISDVDRGYARQAFASASDRASQALALDEAGNHDAAIATWMSIFGEPFSDGKPVGGDYLRRLGAGAAVSTGIVTSTPRTTPTRAWAPR